MGLDEQVVQMGVVLLRAGDVAGFQALLAVHAPAIGDALPRKVEQLIKRGNAGAAVALWQAVAPKYQGYGERLLLALPRLLWCVALGAGAAGGILYLVRSCG